MADPFPSRSAQRIECERSPGRVRVCMKIKNLDGPAIARLLER